MTQPIVARKKTPVTKPVAIYVRLSTKDKGQDPLTQLMPLRAHAERKGWKILSEYVDIGISGSKESRPQLDRLMADIRKSKVGAVLVARFDRFARSTTHLLRALEEFQLRGVEFISLNEAIDTSTPMGKLVFTVLGAVAELERDLIRERVIAGIDRARKQGTRLGRPSHLVDRVKIREQRAAGRSISSIAKEADIARATVRRILAGLGDNNGVQIPKEGGGETPSPEPIEMIENTLAI